MNFAMHIHSQNYHHNQDNTYVHYFQKLARVLSRTSFTSFPTQPSPSHRPMIYFLTQTEKHFLEFRVNGIMYSLASFIQLIEDLPMLHDENTSSRWDFIMTFAKKHMSKALSEAFTILQ